MKMWWMMLVALSLCAALVHAECGSDNGILGPFEENSTIFRTYWFCDKSHGHCCQENPGVVCESPTRICDEPADCTDSTYPVCATSTHNCPTGGVELSAAAVTDLTWKWTDEDSGYVLKDETSVDPNASPYELVISNSYQRMVGTCSNDSDTHCITDNEAADCGSGNTCTIPDSDKTWTQVHLLTSCWTWADGTRCMVDRIQVENLEAWPF